jgi:hypothetical protein
MCGLDSDDPGVFDRIYDCYQKSKIDSFMLNILVPYPNTVLGHRIKEEGRIIDTNWEHYDNRHVVYRPKLMTIDQLANGYIQLTRNIYNFRNVLPESQNILKTNGATAWTAIVIVHKLSFFYDTLRKERALHHG